MNLQALMKQAQSMQKNLMASKEKIEAMEFTGTSELVEVKMSGKKEVISVKIKETELEKDDIEILEDMIVIAMNDAINKINKEIESKMGSQASKKGSKAQCQRS